MVGWFHGRIAGLEPERVSDGRESECFQPDDVRVSSKAAVVQEASVVKEACLLLFQGVNADEVIQFWLLVGAQGTTHTLIS